MRPIHRILDANFNRAREALRVIEDFARFGLDDPSLSGLAKDMRSRLREILTRIGPETLLAGRDTPGDVGTQLASDTEADRAGPTEVVTAAAKRLTEALRTLEEFAKIVAADEAEPLGRLRYEAYALESRMARRMSASARFEPVRLYVLLSSPLCRHEPLTVARAAIDGGADCIQLREKDAPDRAVLALAESLRRLTRDAGVLLIVNDRPDIASAVDADGVHVGQDDLPVPIARRTGPTCGIVGQSTHNLDQLRAATEADYVAVGPMFPTATKDVGPIAGVEYLRQALAGTSKPIVPVGGITADNVGSLVAAGARRVAVCSAVIAAADPAAEAARIREQLPDTAC